MLKYNAPRIFTMMWIYLVHASLLQGFIQALSDGETLSSQTLEPPRSFGQVYRSIKTLVIAVIKRTAVIQV